MKCPICTTTININSSQEEENYYDCLSCGSSLILAGNKCEILKEGSDHLLASDIKSQKNQAEEVSQKATDEQQIESITNITQVPKISNPVEVLKNPEDLEDSVEDQEVLKNPEDLEDSVEDQNLQNSEDLVEDQNLQNSEDLVEDQNLQNSEDQAEDFKEVLEFGNSINQNKDQILLYDLTLSNINSLDIKKQVLLVLENTFLNLPENEEQNIIDGKIKLLKLNPIQTYLIVSSLMGLPIKIFWTQKHIADSKTQA